MSETIIPLYIERVKRATGKGRLWLQKRVTGIGNRVRAFLWGLLSGISEPIGALVGYAIVKASGEDMNLLVYGILFGLVTPPLDSRNPQRVDDIGRASSP